MAYKVLSKSCLGYCEKNNTDDIYDNNTCIHYNLMFYTAHGAYSGSGSSCRNLERVVLVSESTVYPYKLINKQLINSIWTRSGNSWLTLDWISWSQWSLMMPLTSWQLVCCVASATRHQVQHHHHVMLPRMHGHGLSLKITTKCETFGHVASSVPGFVGFGGAGLVCDMAN